MDIDEEGADAETADVATSRAGMIPQLHLHSVNCFGGRLKSHYRVFAAPTNVIQLPDDDDAEEVPQRITGRRGRTLSRRVPSSKVSHSTPALEPVVQRSGDPIQTSVSFADPVSTDNPRRRLLKSLLRLCNSKLQLLRLPHLFHQLPFSLPITSRRTR